MKLRYSVAKVYGPDNGAGGQGGVQSPPSPPSPPPDPLAQFAGIWNRQSPPPPPPPNPGNNNNNNNNNGGTNQQLSATDQYIGRMKYFDGVDSAKLAEAFSQGDPEGFISEMMKVFQNFHRNSLKEVEAVAKHYGDQASTKALEASKNFYGTEAIYNTMFSKYPDMKDPSVAPMAKAALTSLMKTQPAQGGLTPEQCIDKVNEFFAAVGSKFNKAPPNGGNRSQVREESNSGVLDDQGKPMSWDSLFGANS